MKTNNVNSGVVAINRTEAKNGVKSHMLIHFLATSN